MKQITIKDKTYNIGFNVAAEIAYEDISNEPFDPAVIFSGLTTKRIYNLIASAIIANNPGNDIDSDSLLFIDDRKQFMDIAAVAMSELQVWLQIPTMAEQHVETSAPTEESEAEKK